MRLRKSQNRYVHHKPKPKIITAIQSFLVVLYQIRYIFLLLLIGVALFFLVSFGLQQTIITITPSERIVALEQSVPFAIGSGIDKMPYELITLSDVYTPNIKPVALEQEKTNATVEVVLENRYSKDKRTFRPGTQLITKSGKKLITPNKTIVLPGLNGRRPGTTKFTAIVQEAGPSGNISQEEVFIVAYQGSPLYEHINGSMVTDAIGGAIKEKPKYRQSDIDSALAEARQRAIAELSGHIDIVTKDDYISPKGLRNIIINEVLIDDLPALEARLSAVTFNEEDFLRTLRDYHMSLPETFILQQKEAFYESLEAVNDDDILTGEFLVRSSLPLVYRPDTAEILSQQRFVNRDIKEVKQSLELLQEIQTITISNKPSIKRKTARKQSRIVVQLETGELLTVDN